MAGGPVRLSTGAVPVTAGSTVSSGRTSSAWIEFTCRPSATPLTRPWATPTFRGLSARYTVSRPTAACSSRRSRFSAEARSYVERIPNRIVLIDGRRLAELMILHNVGVQDESTFVLKRIDEDFFDQS
jgi:hypothetical protein